MEPGGIEPPTSSLQSSTAGGAKEAETPEKTGDSGESSDDLDYQDLHGADGS